MNAKSILQNIFNLKDKLDLATPEDSVYIQRQIDEQIGYLQCITKEPADTLRKVIDKRYPEWLDGKYLPPEAESP